ncbi:MAG: cytochrome c [Myxococcota bacterium]
MRIITRIVVVMAAFGLAGRAESAPPEKWTKYCVKCHGEDGKGKTKMGEKLKVGDMTTAEWQGKRKDAEMKKRIREGNPEVKQPPFGIDKLTDGEVDELVKFIRSLGGK